MDRNRNDEVKIWTHSNILSDNQHTDDVANINAEKAAKALMEWKPLGERLIMARFNSKYLKLTVITCHAPIDDAEEAKKITFYDQLQQAIQEVPLHDVLCVIGDFKDRVWNDEGIEKIMGRTAEVHQRQRTETLRSARGEQLGHRKNSFPAQRNLQDDLDIPRWQDMLTDRSHHHSQQLLLGVKTSRGADVSNDHQLLMVTLAVKLRLTKRGDNKSKGSISPNFYFRRQRLNFSWNSDSNPLSSPWGRTGRT